MALAVAVTVGFLLGHDGAVFRHDSGQPRCLPLNSERSTSDRRLETLVELVPSDFVVLKKPSIVDCNDLKQIPLAEFNARFARQEIRRFGQDLPASLRRALRKAVHASAILPGGVKALVGRL